MRLSNSSTFRRYAKVEEMMLRAAMPRISAQDREPLVPRIVRRPASLVVKTGFTLAEVAHVASL